MNQSYIGTADNLQRVVELLEEAAQKRALRWDPAAGMLDVGLQHIAKPNCKICWGKGKVKQAGSDATFPCQCVVLGYGQYVRRHMRKVRCTICGSKDEFCAHRPETFEDYVIMVDFASEPTNAKLRSAAEAMANRMRAKFEDKDADLQLPVQGMPSPAGPSAEDNRGSTDEVS